MSTGTLYMYLPYRLAVKLAATATSKFFSYHWDKISDPHLSTGRLSSKPNHFFPGSEERVKPKLKVIVPLGQNVSFFL